MKQQYITSAKSALKTIINRTNFEKIDGWLTLDEQTALADHDFADLKSLINTIETNRDLPYVAIFKADEDGEHFLIDIVKNAEAGAKLGDLCRWEDDDLPHYVEKAWKAGSKDWFVYTEDIYTPDKERILSVVKGVGYRGKTPDQTIYVGTGYSLTFLNRERLRFALIVGAGSFVILMIVGICFDFFIRRNISLPISRVIASTEDFINHVLEVDMRKTQRRTTKNDTVLLAESILTLQRAVMEYSDRIKGLNEKIEKEPLTGLHNREGLINAVRTFLHIPSAKSSYCAFIIIDLDYFKHVNDTFGHAVGDDVLIKTADILRALFRFESSEDIICRFGGDEFVIFLKHISDKIILERKLNDLHAEFAKILLPDKKPLTISAGCAIADRSLRNLHHITYEQLYKRADDALYEVKREGRNGHKIFATEYSEAGKESNESNENFGLT